MTRDESRNILVVDDDPMVLKVVSRMLSSEYRVLTAGDGQDAIRLIQARAPNLVLLDLRMPGIDGFDVLRAVAQEAPKVRVVILSGVSEVETFTAAIDEGAQAYLTKPFSQEDLRNVVKHMISPDCEAKIADDGCPWRVALNAPLSSKQDNGGPSCDEWPVT
jgi:CheY-like chemotaxis protein